VAMMTSTPLHSVTSILPIEKRKVGAYIDSAISNPDMAKNFDDYRIESLTVPVLIFSAMDDRLIKFTDVEKVIRRFPNKVFVPFENGGHLIVGHDVEIHNTVNEFVARYR
jgi:hydrolase, alpha/beta domain protein